MENHQNPAKIGPTANADQALARMYADLLRHRERRDTLAAYFPAEGPLRRELYPKHMAFIAAGLEYRERLFMAANRIGKTDLGAFETTCHLTGLYPSWWHGKRFAGPIQAWVAGDTAKTVRDILQPKLLGERDALGTGMLPEHTIHAINHKTTGSGMVDTIWVRHVSGGLSRVGLKSYAEGRESFQGTAQHVIWLDEEPPQEVYTECLLRTMTVDGLVMVTFTPLQGLTPLIRDFLKDAQASAVRRSSDSVSPTEGA